MNANHYQKSFLLFSSIIYVVTAAKIIPVADPNHITLTFGSCNAILGHEQNEIFNRIAEMKPDVFTWLGDVAYLDIEGFPPKFQFPGEKRAREKFTVIKNDQNYTNLKKSTHIIGIWDDHDYGKDNSGKNFPFKNISRELWLDFIDEPKDSLRRTRKGGIYESYYLGDTSKVKVILLDGRYSRDEPSIPLTSFGANDLLGSEQWEWLENEFKENQAEYVVIGSGIQVLPDDRVLPELWYKQSREKLFTLIRKYKVSGVIILSGDVHYAEIMKYPCKERIGYELYEFTSSGLTHHVSSHISLVSGIFSQIFSTTYNQPEDRYFERNFGVIKFSFGNTNGVKLEARNYYGHPVLSKEISHSELQFDETIIDDNTFCVADSNRFFRFYKHFALSLLQGKIYLWALVLITAFVFVLVGTVIRIIFKILYLIIRTFLGLGGEKGHSGQKPKKD